MVVDARGFLKPDYFIDEDAGVPVNIIEAWDSKILKPIRDSEFLRIGGRGCLDQYEGCGGGRYE